MQPLDNSNTVHKKNATRLGTQTTGEARDTSDGRQDVASSLRATKVIHGEQQERHIDKIHERHETTVKHTSRGQELHLHLMISYTKAI